MVRPVSQETRRKMSEAQKGRKHSLETRLKISMANKGRKLSEEQCAKIKEAATGRKMRPEVRQRMIGRKLSPEICEKMSLARKGVVPSEETRRKISNSNRGKIKTKEHCEAISRSKTGHKMSQETRQKMSNTRREKYQSGELVHPMQAYNLPEEVVREALIKHNSQARAGKELGVSQGTISRMKRKYNIDHDGKDNNHQTRGKGGYHNGKWMRSSWELAFAARLDEAGISWSYEPKRFKLSTGRSYRPDFLIGPVGCFVEVKGHWYPKAKEKFDLFRKEYPSVDIVVIGKEIWKLPLNDFLDTLSTLTGRDRSMLLSSPKS